MGEAESKMERRRRSHERCADRAAAIIESDSKAAITYSRGSVAEDQAAANARLVLAKAESRADMRLKIKNGSALSRSLRIKVACPLMRGCDYCASLCQISTCDFSNSVVKFTICITVSLILRIALVKIRL